MVARVTTYHADEPTDRLLDAFKTGLAPSSRLKASRTPTSSLMRIPVRRSP